MKAEELHLPKLQQPIRSTRIGNLEDYRRWEKQQQKAYRAELDEEVMNRSRVKEHQQEIKKMERKEMMRLVEEEKKQQLMRKRNQTHAEQQYMFQNLSLIRSPPPSSSRVYSPTESIEHPFVKLVEQQDERAWQSKQQFIFQNRLNDIQTQMKEKQRSRNLTYEAEERRKYLDHADQEFQRKLMERKAFEDKYLRSGRDSNLSYQQEYLNYLKEQSTTQKVPTSRVFSQRPVENVSSVSPGNIGQIPLSHDRQVQLATIQRSMKYLGKPQLSAKKYEQGGRRVVYDKVVTEKAATSREMNTIDVRHYRHQNKAATEQACRESSGRQPRQFLHYNIINGNQQIFEH